MSILHSLKKGMIRLLWRTIPVQKNRVVFCSFSGKSYSCNPKAVSEKLHEMDPELEIIWLNNGKPLENIPEYIQQVNKKDRKAYHKTLASCRVYVENFKFSNLPKKKDQFFIQVWHGDRAFKKILYDADDYEGRIIYESLPGFCDLAVAGSDYGTMQYRSAFRYKGEILTEGTPRDDVLFHADPEAITKTKKALELEEEVHYLLYAPTLREVSHNNGVKQKLQGIDIQRTLAALTKRYGGTWKCLMRSPPGVSGLAGVSALGDNVIDASSVPDMSDLLLISDVLITDYSSSAGDFALLKRPLFLFQDDLQEYLKKDRELYFEMKDSPYFAAHSQEELEDLIRTVTEEEVVKNSQEILDFYKTTETGHASEAVAKRIIDYCRS